MANDVEYFLMCIFTSPGPGGGCKESIRCPLRAEHNFWKGLPFLCSVVSLLSQIVSISVSLFLNSYLFICPSYGSNHCLNHYSSVRVLESCNTSLPACFYFSGHFIEMESYNVWSFVTAILIIEHKVQGPSMLWCESKLHAFIWLNNHISLYG